MHVCHVLAWSLQRLEEGTGHWILWNGVLGCCQPLCGSQKPNLDHLQEKGVFLTNENTPQSPQSQ